MKIYKEKKEEANTLTYENLINGLLATSDRPPINWKSIKVYILTR